MEDNLKIDFETATFFVVTKFLCSNTSCETYDNKFRKNRSSSSPQSTFIESQL